MVIYSAGGTISSSFGCAKTSSGQASKVSERSSERPRSPSILCVCSLKLFLQKSMKRKARSSVCRGSSDVADAVLLSCVESAGRGQR